MAQAMTRTFAYFSSTIGQKQIMGITGLIWCGFVLGHMAGNLLMFVSPDAYNWYGHGIVSNPAIYLIETVLVLTLLAHVIKGVLVTIKNKASKGPVAYKGANGAKGSSFAVKTMIFQGVLILLFVIYHLVTFKFGPHYETTVNGIVIRDLFKLLVEKFKDPVYAFGYISMMIVLGFHLSHGFYSSIQTLGFHHSKYSPKLKILGCVYGWTVALGFLSQPVYIYFFYQG